MQLEKINKTETCWIWTGAKSSSGYGSVSLNKKVVSAHRASWIIHNGEILNEMVVMHLCDTPLCVNPEHLKLGTRKDNQRDMVNKKRDQNSRKTQCPKGHEYSGDNLFINNQGKRICRTCKRTNELNAYYKKKVQ